MKENVFFSWPASGSSNFAKIERSAEHRPPSLTRHCLTAHLYLCQLLLALCESPLEMNACMKWCDGEDRNLCTATSKSSVLFEELTPAAVATGGGITLYSPANACDWLGEDSPWHSVSGNTLATVRDRHIRCGCWEWLCFRFPTIRNISLKTDTEVAVLISICVLFLTAALAIREKNVQKSFHYFRVYDTKLKYETF